MKLNYRSVGHETVGEPQACTEVTFQDYERITKARLIEGLPQSSIPYDQEVFPEQIILKVHASAKQVHSIITGKNSVEETRKRIKEAKTTDDRSIEKFGFGEQGEDPI